jgi:hypothetical protein
MDFRESKSKRGPTWAARCDTGERKSLDDRACFCKRCILEEQHTFSLLGPPKMNYKEQDIIPMLKARKLSIGTFKGLLQQDYMCDNGHCKA